MRALAASQGHGWLACLTSIAGFDAAKAQETCDLLVQQCAVPGAQRGIQLVIRIKAASASRMLGDASSSSVAANAVAGSGSGMCVVCMGVCQMRQMPCHSMSAQMCVCVRACVHVWMCMCMFLCVLCHCHSVVESLTAYNARGLMCGVSFFLSCFSDVLRSGGCERRQCCFFSGGVTFFSGGGVTGVTPRRRCASACCCGGHNTSCTGPRSHRVSCR